MGGALASLPLVLGALSLLGALGMAAANRRVDPLRARQRWTKYLTYLLILTLVFLASAMRLLVPLLGAILLLGGWELSRLWPLLPRGPFRIGVVLVALPLAVGALAFASLAPAGLRLVVLLQVFAFDGFCQVAGQWLGRRPLLPRISPAKTWEGLTGGLLAVLSLALLTRGWLPLQTVQALLAGMFTAALAFAGDVGASLIKRRGGLKDFSTLVPAHGGVLDRFDSLIVALAGWALLLAAQPFP